MNSAIEVRNIYKTYKLGQSSIGALVDVSLQLAAGQALFLCGPSGSGKSTLLHIMGCLDQATSGQVIIEGREIGDIDDNTLSDFRAKNIGFIFQNYSLLPVLNTYENIEYPLLLAGIKDRKRRISEILEEVGLTGWEHHFPGELSGGQRQRVAIARALVTEPRILIADEPTANLDSANGSKVLKLMLELARKKNSAVIVSTHDQRLLAQADRIVQLRDGIVAHDGNSFKEQEAMKCTE